MNIDWPAITPWIVWGSIIISVASLVLLPLLLVLTPADYFVHRGPRLGWLEKTHPVIRLAILTLKNVLGLALLLLGVVMLVTPGQGLLAILVGICLMDFPGKRKLERRILRRQGVMTAINTIRAKAGKPPLIPPDECEEEGESPPR